MRYFSNDDLKKISTAIAGAEKATSGEIRVVARHSRHWNERKLTLHQLGVKEFHRLGMQKTEHRTGVLILILFSEKKFQIIADEGIHAKVPEGTWDGIAEKMTGHFKGGNFVEGIIDAVAAVGQKLSEKFPGRSGDSNQLPDDVIER